MEYCEAATGCLQNNSSRYAFVSEVEKLFNHPPRPPFLLCKLMTCPFICIQGYNALVIPLELGRPLLFYRVPSYSLTCYNVD